MPITVNEGGTLYELDTVTSNEGGTLYELDTIHSNEGGTLYEIHKAEMDAVWTSFGSSYATIISQSNGKNSTTCRYEVKSTASQAPNTVKCTFSMKAGQTLGGDWEIEKTGGSTSAGSCYLYNSSGVRLTGWNLISSSIYTATEDLQDCYIVFKLRKSSSSYTVYHNITLTLS